jgi:hypothetical protein
MTKKKRLSIDEAAARLVLIAESALARLPEEEQDARIEAFSKRKFTAARETRAKSSKTSRTRGYRLAARGR